MSADLTTRIAAPAMAQSPLRGILLKICSVTIFTVMGAILKATADVVPVGEQVSFAVVGDTLGSMDGTYVLHPGGDDGAGSCERIGPGGGAPAGTPVYTPDGLALAWAGVQSSANLRLAGGLSGGDGGADAALDQALGNWPVHIRDAF